MQISDYLYPIYGTLIYETPIYCSIFNIIYRTLVIS